MDYNEPIYLADELKSTSIVTDKPKSNAGTNHRLKVFPNPAKNYIIVSYDLSGLPCNLDVEIINSEGKVLFRQRLSGIKNQTVISTASLPASSYTLRLIKETSSIDALKFIILKKIKNMRKFAWLVSVLVIIFQETSGQTRWIRQYHPEFTGPGRSMNVSYDGGMLMTGKLLPNYSHYYWLIKSDVNGEILWEKFIGSNEFSAVGLTNFRQDTNGNIYFGGSIILDGDSDPLIMKLNKCGEKEWCKSISTTSKYDFIKDVVCTPDKGCAAIIFQAYLPEYINWVGIIKFSQYGDFLWQQYYLSQDPGIDNENLSNLLLTADNGFLMTGYCYYPDPEDPGLSWLHPYYVKTDSMGNFEWEVVLHSETADIGGVGWQTILNPAENYYYSCISHYYHSDTLYAKRPALVKMDLQGNVVGVYDVVHENYNWGALYSAAFINDSLLTGGIGWGYNDEESLSRAVIFDTLGIIKDSITLLQTGWLAKTAVTHDGKLLFYNTIEEDDGFDTYLFKLTQDLEHDTFYTTPFIYDSLCPYQIASDTIVPDDCGVIVGIEEETGRPGEWETGGQGEEGKRRMLEIWPNPASGEIHVRWNMDDGRFYRDCELVIYDVFGREVAEIIVPDRQDQIQFNVESYPPGVYIVILRKGYILLESSKFVVAR